MGDFEKALESFRDYLDDVGFANLYRYIASIRSYQLTPFIVTFRTRDGVMATDTYLHGSLDGRRLLWALMTDAQLPHDALTDRERELARRLADLGLLRRDDEVVGNGGWQLIALGESTLFIDATMGFPRAGHSHEVYIGPDTCLLLYYMDAARLPRGARALDLCTGTGIIGLTAARSASRVLSTDIAEKPLFIAGVNRVLNGREALVEVRREDIKDTLQSSERWDLVTCNPPFIATPPEYYMPIFARGPGRDGLDMMRDIVGSLDRLLDERGSALLVADFLGDEDAPFYVAELAEVAKRFAVDVYVDQKIPADKHADAIGVMLARVNPEIDADAVKARTRAYLLDELGARHLFLAVIRVRRGPPGLLVYDRTRGPQRVQPPPGRM